MRTLAMWLMLIACLVVVGCEETPGTVVLQPVEAAGHVTTQDVGPASYDSASDDLTSDEPASPPVVIIPEEDIAAAGLKYYWGHGLDLYPGEKVERMIQLDENLYCLTNDNYMLTVAAKTGVPTWRHQIAEPGLTVYEPVHADEIPLPDEVVGIDGILDPKTIPDIIPFDLVMINTLTGLMVFDRTTGRVVRTPAQIPFTFAANTGGSSDGVNFFVASSGGEIAAIRLAEGISAWEIVNDDLVTAPPGYYSNYVYVGGENNLFFAVQLTPIHKVVWSQATDGPITTAFYVGPHGAFVPCEDMRVYAFDPLSGVPLWEEPFSTRGACRQPIQVAESTVFQYADGDRLYAINLFTGKKRWDMPDGRMVLAVIDEDVYVLDKNKILHVVNETTGEIKVSVSLAQFDLFVRNTTAPALFVGTRDGQIRCLRPTDAEPLTAEMLRATPRPR